MPTSNIQGSMLYLYNIHDRKIIINFIEMLSNLYFSEFLQRLAFYKNKHRYVN